MAMPDPVPGTLLYIPSRTPGDRVSDIDDRTEILEANAFARTSPDLVVPDTFPALPEVILNDAETTNGWGGVTLDATKHTQGTHSVFKKLRSDPGLFANMTWNAPVPVTVGDYKTLSLDLRGESLNTPAVIGGDPWASLFDLVVADGFNLTGNTVVLSKLAILETIWGTLDLDVSSLSVIRSVGIKGVRNSGLAGGSGFTWWMDYLRFDAQNAITTALSRTPSVIVPPSYAAGFDAHTAISGHTLLDMRPSLQLLQRHGGERHIREWDVPDDGSEDVGLRLTTIVKSVPPGTKLLLSPDGQYLNDGTITFENTDFELDAQGATIFTSRDRGDPFGTGNNNFKDHFYNLRGDAGIIRNLTTIGGATLDVSSVVSQGSMTTTPWHLTAQGDEVMTPVATTRYAGRDKDGLLKIRCTIATSIIAQGDVLVRMVDLVTGREMARAYPALTPGGPIADFTLSVNGAPWLGSKPQLFVSKVTAATNTITVREVMTLYNNVHYRGTNDNAAAFTIDAGCGPGWLIEDCRVEGVQTDAIQYQSLTAEWFTVRRMQVIACSRHGMSFNKGRHILVEDCIIREAPRSGIDFEPNNTLVDSLWHVGVKGTEIRNVTNNGFSPNNYVNVWHLRIEDCSVYSAGLGFIAGGGHFLSVRDARCFGIDFGPRGRDMSIEHVTTDTQFAVGGMSGTWDASASPSSDKDIAALGPVTYSGNGSLVSNIAVTKQNLSKHVNLTGTSTDISLRDNTTTQPSYPYYGPIVPTAPYHGVDPGKWADIYPDTFKGMAFSPPWRPGGLNLLDEPLLNVHSLGGSTTKGNNFARMGLVVPAGASTLSVAFPNPVLGALSSAGGQPSSVGGGSLAAGTYWVAVGARSRYGGPRTPTAYNAVTVGASGAIALTLKTGWDTTTELICGLTWFRAGPSASPPSVYTTRYDWLAPTPFFGGRRVLGMTFRDVGTTLFFDNSGDPQIFGYPASVAAQSGSWTLANSTGNEPDTNYGVYLETSWPTDWNITARRQNGFDIAFSNPPVGAEMCGYMVWRA